MRSDGDGASSAGSNGDRNGGCAPMNGGRACSSLPARSLATKICQKRPSWSGESEGTRDAAALALTVAKTSGEWRRTAELRDEIQLPQPGRVATGKIGTRGCGVSLGSFARVRSPWSTRNQPGHESDPGSASAACGAVLGSGKRTNRRGRAMRVRCGRTASATTASERAAGLAVGWAAVAGPCSALRRCAAFSFFILNKNYSSKTKNK